MGLAVFYGLEAKSQADPYLVLLDECLDILTNEISGGGGVWLVDLFPSLQYLPRWIPGLKFKKKAEVWKAKMVEFADKPFQTVKDNMVRNFWTPTYLC